MEQEKDVCMLLSILHYLYNYTMGRLEEKRRYSKQALPVTSGHCFGVNVRMITSRNIFAILPSLGE
eukprot:scaffold3283_cov103-Alexandrium_tamarense.AAC.40